MTIPPEEERGARPAASEPGGGERQGEAAAQAEAQAEGSQLFHAALAFGLIPGVSPLLALVGVTRLREAPRWSRRLVALAVLDIAVFVALGVAMVVTASQLGLGAVLGGPLPAPTAPGEVASPAPAIGPRPRIGVVVDDAEGGGARVEAISPGSPAADVGLREGDVITAIDGASIADREALVEGIARGPLASRALSVTRDGDALALDVTPVAGPFRPVPLDAQRCADAAPDLEATREALSSPGTLVTLGVITLVTLGLFGWGRRKGLTFRESAKVVLPFVAILFVGPTLGGLAASLACPLLVSTNVRYETVEIFFSEIVLVGLALSFYAANRGLGPRLHDELPRLGYLRTVAQSVLYVFAWMPRALLLTTPIAVFLFSEGAFDEAPVAELVSGAGRTTLDAVLTVIAAALLAPVAEECLFRGVLAPHLARLTDAFPAVLLTAAIFGVLHIGGHGPLFVGPMFLGAILGWARLRSGGLAAPITLHVMLNGTAMTLALVLGLD